MLLSNLVVGSVDDDRRVRSSVQNVLESAGYEAVNFESAETCGVVRQPPKSRMATAAIWMRAVSEIEVLTVCCN